MGLDIYLDWDGKTEDDKHAQYKANEVEEFASAGYLRSSYSDGGFNSWARQHIGGKDLYWIFGCPGEDGPGWQVFGKDEYGDDDRGFVPDWQASRARAMEVVGLVEAAPPFSIVRVSGKTKTYDEGDVIPAFMKHKEQWDGKGRTFEWYSSSEGLFFQSDRPVVVAVMWQQDKWDGATPVLICESDHAYYRQFAQAVVDFIDVAQTRPNPRMSWSG